MVSHSNFFEKLKYFRFDQNVLMLVKIFQIRSNYTYISLKVEIIYNSERKYLTNILNILDMDDMTLLILINKSSLVLFIYRKTNIRNVMLRQWTVVCFLVCTDRNSPEAKAEERRNRRPFLPLPFESSP